MNVFLRFKLIICFLSIFNISSSFAAIDIIIIQKINYLQSIGKNSHQISALLIKDHNINPSQLRELNLPSQWTVSIELALLGYSPQDLANHSLPKVIAFRNTQDNINYVVKDSYLFTYKDGLLLPTTNWCRDKEWALGSAHKGEVCFREIMNNQNSSSGQICFYRNGGGYDSKDTTGWAKGFDGPNRYLCNYSYYNGIKHIFTDYLPYKISGTRKAINKSMINQMVNILNYSRPTIISPCHL